MQLVYIQTIYSNKAHRCNEMKCLFQEFEKKTYFASDSHHVMQIPMLSCMLDLKTEKVSTLKSS